ncbi:MAG: hypothetical protein FWF44_06890 [Defluviitaleaceae bacterium]|nr:hypothetical protein [Defluviitaleaceae bacterium]
MSEKSIKWVEAAQIFDADTNAIVMCPECGSGNLKNLDIESKDGLFLLERVMYCAACGAKSYLRINRKKHVED